MSDLLTRLGARAIGHAPPVRPVARLAFAAPPRLREGEEPTGPEGLTATPAALGSAWASPPSSVGAADHNALRRYPRPAPAAGPVIEPEIESNAARIESEPAAGRHPTRAAGGADSRPRPAQGATAQPDAPPKGSRAEERNVAAARAASFARSDPADASGWTKSTSMASPAPAAPVEPRDAPPASRPTATSGVRVQIGHVARSVAVEPPSTHLDLPEPLLPRRTIAVAPSDPLAQILAPSRADGRVAKLQAADTTEVHVSIGRIEVTAATEPAAPKRPRRVAPAMTLDEYLARRRKERP